MNRVYGADYTYGAEYIIPKPFDPRVVQWVAPAVAEAAMETGVARVELDVKDYRERMRTLLGGATGCLCPGSGRSASGAARPLRPRRLTSPPLLAPGVIMAVVVRYVELRQHGIRLEHARQRLP